MFSWDLKSAFIRNNFGEMFGCVVFWFNGILFFGLEFGFYVFDLLMKKLKFLSEFEFGLNTRSNDGRVDRVGFFVIGSYNNVYCVDVVFIGGLWCLFGNGGELEEILDYKFRCSNCICFLRLGMMMFFCDISTRKIY